MTTLSIETPKDLETAQAIEGMLEAAKALPIHDGNYQHIAEGTKQVKARIKEIEKQRDLILDPLKDAEKAVRAFFRPALDGYTALESVLKGKLLQHHNALAARKAEAVAQFAAAPGAPEAPRTLAVLAAQPPPSGASVRETWACEVVNPLAVPREFLVVDEPALLRYARSLDPGQSPQVPGVRFFKKQGVAIR